MTRNGFPVRIICFDKKGERPIVALISESEGKEYTIEYTDEGHLISNEINESYDLVMAPVKHVGWVNMDKHTIMYDTEEEARAVLDKQDEKLEVVSMYDFFVPVKVEWEE